MDRDGQYYILKIAKSIFKVQFVFNFARSNTFSGFYFAIISITFLSCILFWKYNSHTKSSNTLPGEGKKRHKTSGYATCVTHGLVSFLRPCKEFKVIATCCRCAELRVGLPCAAVQLFLTRRSVPFQVSLMRRISTTIWRQRQLYDGRDMLYDSARSFQWCTLND